MTIDYKELNAPEKVVKNVDKIFKPTSYDIRAYVGEPDNFFSDDAVFTPESAEVVGTILGCQEFVQKTGVRMSIKIGDTVVIGYDNGPTSEALANAMAKAELTRGRCIQHRHIIIWSGISEPESAQRKGTYTNHQITR